MNEYLFEQMLDSRKLSDEEVIFARRNKKLHENRRKSRQKRLRESLMMKEYQKVRVQNDEKVEFLVS